MATLTWADIKDLALVSDTRWTRVEGRVLAIVVPQQQKVIELPELGQSLEQYLRTALKRVVNDDDQSAYLDER